MHPYRAAVALLLLFASPLLAKGPVNYIDFSALPLRTIISNPPAPGSRQNNADIHAVLALQTIRTREQIARARSEEKLTPAVFRNVLGSWFTPSRAPLTFALLTKAGSDTQTASYMAKRLWNRPRPPLQNKAIRPAVQIPPNSSYPSFHAVRGALWAAILSRLSPDLRSPVLVRGQQIGDDRVLIGIHFPTDVSAGRKLGRYMATQFFRNRAFQRDFARAQAEIANMHRKRITPFNVRGAVLVLNQHGPLP